MVNLIRFFGGSVMGYKIITADSVQELEHAVNMHIEEGWTTIGGVAVIQWTTDVVRLFQAVFKTPAQQ